MWIDIVYERRCIRNRMNTAASIRKKLRRWAWQNSPGWQARARTCPPSKIQHERGVQERQEENQTLPPHNSDYKALHSSQTTTLQTPRPSTLDRTTARPHDVKHDQPSRRSRVQAGSCCAHRCWCRGWDWAENVQP